MHAPGLPAFIAPAFALGGYRGGRRVDCGAAPRSAPALVWKAGISPDARRRRRLVRLGRRRAHGARRRCTARSCIPDPMAGVVLAAGALALVAASIRERRRAGRSAKTPSARRRGPDGDRSVWVWRSACCPGCTRGWPLPAGILAVLLVLHMARDRVFSGDRWRHLVLFCCADRRLCCGLARILSDLFTARSIPRRRMATASRSRSDRSPAACSALMTDQEFGLRPERTRFTSCGWLVSGRCSDGAHVWASSCCCWSCPTRLPRARFRCGGRDRRRRLAFSCRLSSRSASPLRARGRIRADAAERASLTLLGASVMIATAVAFGGDGRLAYNASTGRARWLDWAGSLVDLPRGFPSFFRAAPAPLRPLERSSSELARPGVLLGRRARRRLDRVRGARQVASGDAADASAHGAGVPGRGLRARDDGDVARRGRRASHPDSRAARFAARPRIRVCVRSACSSSRCGCSGRPMFRRVSPSPRRHSTRRRPARCSISRRCRPGIIVFASPASRRRAATLSWASAGPACPRRAGRCRPRSPTSVLSAGSRVEPHRDG